MYKSDRFGGDKTIVGGLFMIAAASASLLASLSSRSEREEKEENRNKSKN
jgi:hypothetical protein